MAISPQRLTIYSYSTHRAVIFAIAQLSCIYKLAIISFLTADLFSLRRFYYDNCHVCHIIASNNETVVKNGQEKNTMEMKHCLNFQIMCGSCRFVSQFLRKIDTTVQTPESLNETMDHKIAIVECNYACESNVDTLNDTRNCDLAR